LSTPFFINRCFCDDLNAYNAVHGREKRKLGEVYTDMLVC